MQSDEVKNLVEQIYQRESRRVFATLMRVVRDFDIAEEAMHEAFAAAVEQWANEGVPENPRAWLVTVGRFKAVDRIRRESRLRQSSDVLVDRMNRIVGENSDRESHEIEDDRLRLIFTCCHPAIDPLIQVPLTLREVCGLTTEEIAAAFLISPSTMAQRIVRGKAKVRDAGIPYAIPSVDDLPERLEAVQSVIYLVFNEGYSASAGDSVLRPDLSSEAIRLARLVLELLPDPEVEGLLALMLLHESRRSTRVTEAGDIVLLEDQDRTQWDRELIVEGTERVSRSLSSGNFGIYTIQAAISAVHANAGTPEETDWAEIVALYDLLTQATSSAIVKLNRAVAISMRDGPDEGLLIIDDLLRQGLLHEYHLIHAAKGEFLRRKGDLTAARSSLETALAMARQEPERRLLMKKLEDLAAEY
ncbi:RNA polymerase sigma factor [Thalassoglobus sp. JC818]|uniref:RNA polymerase sigma factor n=1 Tax=Thalassoglobus sp. JC818 TaxID=3232136 RepID=UPI003458E77E